MKAFRKGEDWAFTEIDHRLRKPLFNYLFQYVRNAETTEELTQEVFIKIYRFRLKYNSRLEFSSWFWTIAKNTVIDWKRREQHLISTDSFEDETSSHLEVRSPVPDAEILALNRLERQNFRKLLNRLPRLQKKVLLFRLIHQLSYSEISKNLGISITAAKCAAHRAKIQLIQFTELMSAQQLLEPAY